MNRETIQKLLGGYATGTLTPAEQQALFAAALDDQELFDALAREQSLRDLLRDPAAKARVLTALDDAATHAPARWYKKRPWLPAIAALAMVEIGLMTVVVLRRNVNAPPPVMVAEVKRSEVQHSEVKPAAPVPAAPLADGRGPVRLQEPRPLESDAVETRKRRLKPLPNPTGITGRTVGGAPGAELPPPSPPPVSSAITAAAVRKDEAAPSPPLLPQQAQQQQPQSTPGPYVQSQQPLGMFQGATQMGVGALGSRFGTVNARLLFYGNAAVPPAGGGGARLEMNSEEASNKKAAPAQMRAASGRVAAKSVAPPAAHLGVRYSILRKQPDGEFAEVVMETVLDSGEAVRLKLVTNDYGYLLVWENGPNGIWRQVAAGPVEPLKPFETPLAGSNGAGPRQLYVQFTRNSPAGFGGAPPESPLTSLPASLLVTQARNNLIQTAADVSDKATYVVNRASDPAAQQVIVPITLNYK